MALIRNPEKEDMDYISHRLPATIVKRYHAFTERAKKMRVNVAASYTEMFVKWLDESEAELDGMNVSRLRTTTKSEG